MTLNAMSRGWGDPDSSGYFQLHIKKITTLDGVPLYVRAEAAHLFQGFLDELVRSGYAIHGNTLDDWGYNNRDIRGYPGVKSNHAWGLAIDINALQNPMTDKLITNMPPSIADRARSWGLRWGGSYDGRKDPMHFEFEGTPADVLRFPTRPQVVAPNLPNYTGDDLMAIAKDDNDARRALIRQWMHMFWGRGPNSVQELDIHNLNFSLNGADAALTAIVDDPQSQAYKNRLTGA